MHKVPLAAALTPTTAVALTSADSPAQATRAPLLSTMDG